ncbi:hypothetical protein MMC07_009303 [Pseudocyphellaria aurata]|nr:hypothetical protein [Pseudocyphellaria aurata]
MVRFVSVNVVGSIVVIATMEIPGDRRAVESVPSGWGAVGGHGCIAVVIGGQRCGDEAVALGVLGDPVVVEERAGDEMESLGRGLVKDVSRLLVREWQCKRPHLPTDPASLPDLEHRI